jgi:hypothetical protein
MDHIFFNCPINQLETAQLTLELTNLNIAPEGNYWQILDLLKTKSLHVLEALVTFIRKTKTSIQGWALKSGQTFQPHSCTADAAKFFWRTFLESLIKAE